MFWSMDRGCQAGFTKITQPRASVAPINLAPAELYLLVSITVPYAWTNATASGAITHESYFPSIDFQVVLPGGRAESRVELREDFSLCLVKRESGVGPTKRETK